MLRGLLPLPTAAYYRLLRYTLSVAKSRREPCSRDTPVGDSIRIMSTWLGAGLGFTSGFRVGVRVRVSVQEHVDLGPSRAQRRQLLVGLITAHLVRVGVRVRVRARIGVGVGVRVEE